MRAGKGNEFKRLLSFLPQALLVMAGPERRLPMAGLNRLGPGNSGGQPKEGWPRLQLPQEPQMAWCASSPLSKICGWTPRLARVPCIFRRMKALVV